jgi:hypothetical protein
MRPLAALCHLSLGNQLEERGRPEQSSGHLARAVAMLQQMDMTFWLKSATAVGTSRAS